MRVLYLLSVWFHILAVIVWLGGAAFLTLVVVPWMRAGDRARGAALMRDLGTRLRTVGWSCFAIMLTTGCFNLWIRGVRVGSLFDPTWRRSEFGAAVIYKLIGFALILGLSIAHDFVLGPRAAARLASAPDDAGVARLRRQASMLARVTVLLGLAMVGLGVVVVRGWP